MCNYWPVAGLFPFVILTIGVQRIRALMDVVKYGSLELSWMSSVC